MKVVMVLFSIVFAFNSANVFALDSSQIFGRLQLISDLEISPDGKRIAYLQDVEGKYHIVSKNLYDDNEKPIVYTLQGESRIREITWGNNSSIIFWATVPFYSRGDYETFTLGRVGILSIKNGNVEWPFSNAIFNYNFGAPSLINKLADDPDHVLLSNYYTGNDGQTINALYKINLEDGDRDKVFSNANSGSWITSHNGDVIAYKTFEKKYDSVVWKIRKNSESDFADLLVLVDKELVPFDNQIVDISFDKELIYFFYLNEDKINVLAQAKVEENKVVNIGVVKDFKKYDIAHSITDSISGLFAGVRYIGEYSEFEFNDAHLSQVNANLKATFPNAEVEITSYSKDFNRFIVKVSGSTYPVQYFFYDKKNGDLALVAEGFPEATNLELKQVTKFQYSTSDNLTIEAYLTFPKVNGTNKPPLIVMPHGGPESRVDAGFSWERQFFASQGFAVFEPNFRGSSGYGRKFAEAGYGEWGDKMQRDIDEGVAELIKTGKVDAEKICVVGGSYGGYVALFSATARQDLYKCAVSYGGISSLDHLFHHEKRQKSSATYWEKSIGKRQERETLKARSPLHLVSESTRPILMFHGDNDTIVPLYQSTDMFKVLKEAKIQGSRFIELENEDHWFSNGESRRIYLEESLKFINQQLNIVKSSAP